MKSSNITPPKNTPQVGKNGIRATNIQGLHDETVIFSFKYLDCYSEKFEFDSRDSKYFLSLISRIRDVSTMKAVDFEQKYNKTLRNHPIDWRHSKISESTLGIKGRADVDDKAFQFSISSNEHGRVHGFLIDTIFFVRWLDHEHKLYPVD